MSFCYGRLKKLNSESKTIIQQLATKKLQEARQIHNKMKIQQLALMIFVTEGSKNRLWVKKIQFSNSPQWVFATEDAGNQL